MNVGWLIDAEMFPHYCDEIVAVIKDQGHFVKLIQSPNPPYRWNDVECSYRDEFPAGRCVVAHGDIELVTEIHDERRWKPGAFCTINNYFCSKYVIHFGEFWLNQDYVMLPFGDLMRQREFLLHTFGNNGRVFARPDSPLKLFAGQTIGEETFAADVDFMGFYEFPRESIVVVSSAKQVVSEWRFIAADREIVAGCIYSRNGKFEPDPEYDEDARELAAKIAALGYAPDPVWVIDICETIDGCLHLLEIGGFSFSDLYACDKSEVVRAVSAAALSAWR